MKTYLRYLTPALGLVAIWPVARAADEAKQTTEQKRELRVITTSDKEAPRGGGGAVVRRLGGPIEKEIVTFLGVETSPVSPTLAAQLGLQEGAGLVVNHVAPDSPAAGVLKVHDLLLKLDDQILIEQRQFQVLIRGHKEGDEVTLTYLRGGKQSTAKVKLSKHEVPKVSAVPGQPGINVFGFNQGGVGGVGGPFEGPGPAQMQREELDRLLGMLNNGNTPGMRRMSIANAAGGPGDRNISITVNTGNSHIVLDDDKGSLDLTIKEGKKELVAKNAKGEQVFSGPVNTPEERKALPEDVRARLEKLEDSTQFRYKVDGDFKGAETRTIRPRGQGISAPLLPAAEPVRRTGLFL